MNSIPQDDLMLDRTRIFEEFLTAESPIYSYKDDILRMLRLDQSRLDSQHRRST